MKIPDKYYINSVSYDQCKDWLLNKHYAKRMSLITYSFGLYNTQHILQGVCTFGLASPKINNGKSIFNNFRCKVIELNRLVVNENLEKNVLSFFVSQCLKNLPKNICVISFADKSHGHNGYIYQATNFLYTGLSVKGGKMKDYILNKQNFHSLTVTEKMITEISGSYATNMSLDENWKRIGGKIVNFEQKHRYIKLLFPKKIKHKIMQDLKYKPIPYPKGDNNRYDSSYKPITQTKLF